MSDSGGAKYGLRGPSSPQIYLKPPKIAAIVNYFFRTNAS